MLNGVQASLLPVLDYPHCSYGTTCKFVHWRPAEDEGSEPNEKQPRSHQSFSTKQIV